MINKPREYFQSLKYDELVNAIEFIKMKLKNELIKAFGLSVVELPLFLNSTKEKFQPKREERSINFDASNVPGLHVMLTTQNRILRNYLTKIGGKVGTGIFSQFTKIDRDAEVSNISNLHSTFYNVDIVIDEKKSDDEVSFKVADKLFIIFSQIQQQVNKQFGLKNAWSPEYNVESWNKFVNRYRQMSKNQREQVITELHDIVLVSDFKSTNKFDMIDSQISITDYHWDSLVRCIANIGSSGNVSQLFEIFVSPTKQQFEEQVNIFENKHLLLDQANESYTSKASFVNLSIRINIDLVVMKLIGAWHIAEVVQCELDPESEKIFKQYGIVPYFQ